jgi:hypothetical protein
MNGDPLDELDEAWAEVASLRLAIRRLADQDATLSACEGNVTVTVDATLTDAERAAIQRLIEDYEGDGEPASAGVVATLRGLLERTK